MKTAIILLGLGMFLGPIFLFPSEAPVSFESLESKTEDGQPVFNRIRFVPGWEDDIWLMQQSHHGFDQNHEKWDKLAIVVHKTSKPFTATFYQLSPGNFNFEPRPIPFSARCFACHASGPRAIRINSSSGVVVPGSLDKIKIAIWNWRIRSYGRVTSLAAAQFDEGAPFRSDRPVFARSLKLATCLECHSNTGSRTELKLEHVGTANFLVRKGLMPPYPFRATADEIRTLENYTK